MITASTKEEIKKIVKQKISENIPKQRIFEELKHQFNNNRLLAKTIQNETSLSSKKKYKNLNLVLMLALVLIGLTNLVNIKTGGIILIDACLIYLVANYKGYLYQWISFRAIISLAVIILFVFLEGKYISLTMFGFYISFVLTVITAVLGFYLGSRLCPEIEESKELKIDADGNEKYELNYKFKD